MKTTPAKKGFYPGWWIVITSMLIMGVVFAAIISLPGVFTTYVTAEFGVTRTAFTTHMTISTLAAMFSALVAGKILQKYNIKRIMVVFSLVVTVCFLGYASATQLWHFYIISAVGGISMMFYASVPISMLINNWFGKKVRGKAMGIALSGSGIGAMILNPLLSFINANYGWRMSYLLLAALALLLVPLVIATIHRSPEERGIAKLGEETGAVETPGTVSGLTAGQATKRPAFWIMSVTFFLFAMTTTVFNTNGIPYFTDIGFDAVRAATFMSIASAAVIVGKLLLGAACDKWGARIGSMGAIMCLIIGMSCLIGASKVSILAVVSVAIFGLGNTVGTVSIPLIIGELFGNRDFGTLVGFGNVATHLGASVGPLFGSIIFDSTNSYIAAWAGAIALMVLMFLTLNVAYKLRSRTKQQEGEAAVYGKSVATK